MKERGICLLNDSFPPQIDGVANTVVNYAKNILQDGGKPYVITPEHPDADDSAFPYPIFRYPGLDMRNSLGYMAGYPFSPKIAKKLDSYTVNIIHTHCPYASAVMARSLREIIPAPLILTYHTKFDVDIRKFIKNRLIQESALKILSSNVNACDEVWVVSRGAGENLRGLGYEGDYIVMQNGVDVPKGRLPEDEYMALTEEYGLQKDVPVFLFVGRMMWYKGVRIILEALAGIHSQGKDFRMIFVGGGADEDDMKLLASELGIAGKCIFTGRIHDRTKLKAIYCRANMMLFPSVYDTNGLVVREAAACSLPAALVAGSCAAEETIADRNAFHITESSASLAALLMRVMDNPDFIRRVGENAADELYISWAEAVHAAEERYEIVLDNYWSGKYKTKHTISREYLKFSAEMMDALGEIYGAAKKLQNYYDSLK